MPPKDEDKLNRVEELKNKLYSRDYGVRVEHRDSFTRFKTSELPESWDTEDAERIHPGEHILAKTSVFKNFFIFSLLFFLIGAGYAAYVFFAGTNTVSKDNIEISVLGNNFVAGGEELALVVGIANKNASSLDLVDMIVEYPRNSTKLPSETTAQTDRLRLSLGTIPAGAVRNENVKLVLFGEQGSVVPVRIAIEYRVEGSNAIFLVEKLFEVSINSTPVNLSIQAPSTITTNQDINLDIKATLNATNPLSSVLVKVDYPLGFVFESATPPPTLGDNIWNLGDLSPGADRNISIVGSIVDAFEGEEKIFRIASGTQSKSDKSEIDVVFNSLAHAVSISQPFIGAKIVLNGFTKREHAVESKTAIRGEIEWANNLNTKVTDLKIIAKISGNALDKKTVNGIQGFYNSSEEVITWDKTSVPKFSEVNPGDSGRVAFSFSPLSSISAGGSSPSINIAVDISGKQSTQGFETKDLKNSESTVVKIISNLGFSAKALYFSGPFSNNGSLSPKVGEETTYTIVWTITNSANSVSGGKVLVTLPSWVRFVGPVSPATENLVYNPNSREVSWNVGSIPSGTGVTGQSREVAFQIGFTPSLSQISSLPIIINDATLTGRDDFANVNVRVNRGALRTRLDSDPSFPAGAGLVVE